MAKDDERPQFNPKHRIAGAIILVSLAVIFVPMLLDESKPPAENTALTQIPARESSDTKIVVTPVTTPTKTASVAADPLAEKSQPETVAVAPTAAPETSALPRADDGKSMPAVDKKNDSTPAKARPVVARAERVSGNPEKPAKGWVVQVGTFANTGNADRLREKLKSRGYSVNAEPVSLQGSKAVRLSVGPFQDKPTAVRKQTQLQSELNIQGLVLAYP